MIFKKIALFIVALASLFVGATYADEFKIQDLSQGIYSYPSADKIPDNSAAFIQNAYTDIEPIAQERNGYVKRDSTVLGGTKAVYGLWEFLDSTGADWIISYSSNTFYKNTIGTTPTAFGPVTTVSQIPDCAKNLGVIMCVNGTDPAWTFDGSSTRTISTAPLGKIIEAWRTRFAISNIGGAQSTIRFSADGSTNTWALGGNAGDPFAVPVGGGNDGEYVRCLHGSYLDSMIIGRKYDLWAIDGFSQDDYTLRNISNYIGCIEPRTVQEIDGELVWMSDRGLEAMNGRQIHLISEPIRDVIDTIVKNTVNQRSNTQTSQSDWEAGAQIPSNFAYTARSPGNLIAGSTSSLKTTQADWATFNLAGGNVFFIDTETVSGNIQTTFPDYFGTYRDGSAGTKQVWTTTDDSNPATGIVTINSGVLTLSADSTFGRLGTIGTTLDFLPSTTWYVVITTISASNFRCGVATTRSHNGPKAVYISGKNFNNQLCVQVAVINGVTVLTDNSCSGTKYNFPASYSINIDTVNTVLRINGITVGSHDNGLLGKTYTWWMEVLDIASPIRSASIDNFSIAPQTFTYTAPVFDTGVSSPAWEAPIISTTDIGNSLQFSAQVSTDGVNFDSSVAISSGVAMTNAKKRYIKTSIIGNYLNYLGSTASVSDIFFSAYSTGTFTSQIISIGSLITSWGPVAISDQKLNGSISYSFGSTTTPSVLAISNWAPIANGGIPTVSTNPYAAFLATMTALSSTSTIVLSDFQTTWSEGGTVPSPVSTNYDRRYWISYTTSSVSSPTLDSIYVWQRTKSFTFFRGINAGSFALWRDKLYFGNSNNTGYVYQFDTGSNDDSAAISCLIRTKSYDWGQFFREKDFRQAWASYLADASFIDSFSLTYDLDRSGSSYALGSAALNETTGQNSAKFPFPMSNPLQGREIQFTVTKNGSGDKLRLYDLSAQYAIKQER